MSVRPQRELLGLNRSSLYYEPTGETAENLRLMRLIDEQYTARPFHGGRRMTAWLIDRGEEANRKRVRRLMRIMGLEAIYPKPRLSQPVEGHRIYPCLLRSVTVERPNLVWSADITYVPMASGFMYLTTVIDWYSRYVVAWRLSDTLDGSFRLEMLEEALRGGGPEVFNTDQGAHFTATAFVGRLERTGVAVSMDGRVPVVAATKAPAADAENQATQRPDDARLSRTALGTLCPAKYDRERLLCDAEQSTPDQRRGGTMAQPELIRATRPWALGLSVLLFTYAAVGGAAGVIWLVDLASRIAAGPPPTKPFITAWSVNLLFAPIALVGGVLALRCFSAAESRNIDDLERASATVARLRLWARVAVIVLIASLACMFLAAVLTGEFPG